MELFRKGVPIENVERDILLGSLRKDVRFLNHGHNDLLEQVNQLEISTQPSHSSG